MCAAVIVKAISDVRLWRSDAGQRYREAAKRCATAPQVDRPALWEEYGLNPKSFQYQTLRELHKRPDPTRFLLDHTVYHQMLGIPPGAFAGLMEDPDWLDKAMELVDNMRQGEVQRSTGRKNVQPASLENLRKSPHRQHGQAPSPDLNLGVR